MSTWWHESMCQCVCDLVCVCVRVCEGIEWGARHCPSIFFQVSKCHLNTHLQPEQGRGQESVAHRKGEVVDLSELTGHLRHCNQVKETEQVKTIFRC